MDVFILAAGRGQRLMPLTTTTPKPLIQIGKLALIEIHLIRLQRAGFTRAIINLAYLGEQIIEYLGDGARYDITIDYSHEQHGALETAGGIRHALQKIRTEHFLLVNADILTDYPFQSLHTQGAHTSSNHLVLIDNPAHHPNGDFDLHQGQVLNPMNSTAHASPSSLTYSGIARLSKSLFAPLPPGKTPLAPLLRQAIQEKMLTGEHYAGMWHDIGTPERLEAARASPTIQAWIDSLNDNNS